MYIEDFLRTLIFTFTFTNVWNGWRDTLNYMRASDRYSVNRA